MITGSVYSHQQFLCVYMHPIQWVLSVDHRRKGGSYGGVYPCMLSYMYEHAYIHPVAHWPGYIPLYITAQWSTGAQSTFPPMFYWRKLLDPVHIRMPWYRKDCWNTVVIDLLQQPVSKSSNATGWRHEATWPSLYTGCDKQIVSGFMPVWTCCDQVYVCHMFLGVEFDNTCAFVHRFNLSLKILPRQMQ